MKAHAPTLILIILAFSYILCMYWAWSIHKDAVEMQSWPTSEGVILESHIEYKVKASDSSRSRSYDYFYQLVVRYIYEAAGKPYHGDKVAQEVFRETVRSEMDIGGFNPGKELQDKLSMYPQGAKVLVKVNPKNPKDTVLEVRTDWHIYKGPIVIACFLTIFLYFFYGAALQATAVSGIPFYARTSCMIAVATLVIAVIPGIYFVIPQHLIGGIIYILVWALAGFSVALKFYREGQ